MITLRVKETFKSVSNKSKIRLESTSFASDGTKPVLVKILLNPTITGGSWVSVSDDSVVETNNTATISNGVLIMSFFLGKSESQYIDLNDFENEIGPLESFSING
jgi:hypothetical protein